MNHNITIIGGGNLGTAIAEGLADASGDYKITITRRRPELIKHLEIKNICVISDNVAALKDSGVIILAVKPHQIDAVLEELEPFLKNQIIISMVTGKTLQELRTLTGSEAALFRAMPNTAIARRQSMTCISSDNADEKQIALVSDLFRALGEVAVIQDELMDAATVLGSCGIAFALRYIRAAMQGGIQIGFSSETALLITAQTVKGAASLLLDQKSHPEQEIDKVTTPQGCTIAGINQMEHEGFSSSLIKGINTSFEAIEQIKTANKKMNAK